MHGNINYSPGKNGVHNLKLINSGSDGSISKSNLKKNSGRNKEGRDRKISDENPEDDNLPKLSVNFM